MNIIKKKVVLIFSFIFLWLTLSFCIKTFFPQVYPFSNVFISYDNKIRSILEESGIKVEKLIIKKSKLSKSLETKLSKGIFLYEGFEKDVIVEWFESENGNIVLDCVRME